MTEQQQYIPPDPRQAVVEAASRKYQRAGQVAADAVYAMHSRLSQRTLMAGETTAIVTAAVPAIMKAILDDDDVLDPQGEET